MAVTDRSREQREHQLVAAAARYGATSEERREVERQRDAGVAFPDSRDALAARAARLLDQQAVPAAMAVEAVRAEPLSAPAAYERILGVSKELQAWSFLPRGARAARTVARISVRENGRELPIGTGFLVSPHLLLTNHHVLPDADAARQGFAEFEAQVTVDNTPQAPTRLDLDPAAFFTADERLDFALVRVAPGPDGRPPGETFGWNRLSAQLGKLVIGEPVNVVGHPMGRLKEIAVRDNMLQVRLDDFLHYRTDTEPGNSGSPVYNDQWEVVALHHSGVPRTDDRGRVLRRDGQVWRPGDGDDAIDWVANEGVRISSVLRHLAALPLTPRERALLAEMEPETGLEATGTPTAQVTAPVPTAPPSVVPAAPAAERAESRAGLPGRTGAFGGDRHLVFLHGRDQQGKIPQEMRRKWTAGLNEGLVRAGLRPLDPEDVWLPFYGDELVQALAARETAPRLVEASAATAPDVVTPATPTTRAVYQEIVAEAATKWYLPQEGPAAAERFGPDDVAGALRRRLGWLAARSDLDAWTIALVFRDVAAYLDDPHVRERVLDCVLRTMPASGEVVLVSHSLGTVVALDLVTRLSPEVNVVHLTTAGSPLGLDSVYGRLLVGGPKRPDRVADWFKVWCPTDPVAIGCPLGDDWADGLTDFAVVNPHGRAHNIEEYLSHTAVARSIDGSLRR
ncbi:trypsin-like serine peptidase [Streptomyces sp. NPDC085946]|uniref:trypsin-like serine peptidase n=1 Tax=Streptomyces sp. NPDC085946 TaxID=3365744 RepID=UPI0037CD1947